MPSFLTTEQIEASDMFHLNLINMKVEYYTWIDTGNIYKCDNGSITPADMKGFSDLVCIVSKDFAKKYVELPNLHPFIKIKIRKSDYNVWKYEYINYLWVINAPHQKAEKPEKPKKVKKGKKNRGKR